MPHQCSAGTKKTSCITQQDAPQINRNLTKTLSSDDTPMHRDSTVDLRVTPDAGVKVKTKRCIKERRDATFNWRLIFNQASVSATNWSAIEDDVAPSVMGPTSYKTDPPESRMQSHLHLCGLVMLQDNSFFH